MLLNKNILDILKEFSSDYHKRIYGRAIAEKLRMNQKTVSNILNNLEKENILKFSQEGKNKYYFLNMLNPDIKEIIKIIETERKIEFINKNKNFRELFKKLEENTQGILVIFGSYANYTNNKNSDLDVFVIGNTLDLNELEELYNIKINIVKSTKQKFNKNEVFIKEIIKNHVILKGIEELIELIW